MALLGMMAATLFGSTLQGEAKPMPAMQFDQVHGRGPLKPPTKAKKRKLRDRTFYTVGMPAPKGYYIGEDGSLRREYRNRKRFARQWRAKHGGARPWTPAARAELKGFLQKA